MTNPKHVFVTVVLENDDPLAFHIDSEDLQKDSNGDLVFKNDHHPGFQIEFELFDKTGLGYLFPPNNKKSDAIWSQMGTSCPKTTCDDVFKIQSVRPHRKAVVVHNANTETDVGRFQYSLNVTKDDGKSYLLIDPGGVNQNGPTRPLQKAALLAAGAAVGVLATLGTQALLLTS